MTKIKSYRELIKYNSFMERYLYLKLDGQVGNETFGSNRHMNQYLYTSNRWKKTRSNILLRDSTIDNVLGSYVLDLGHIDNPIYGIVLIHHINPLTEEDIELDRDCIYDPDNLISTTLTTHNAIHFSNEKFITDNLIIERAPNDTVPWKRR